MRQVRRAGPLLVAVAVSIAPLGCGRADQPPPVAPSRAPAPTATAVPRLLANIAPLTGLPAGSADLAGRRAVAVAVTLQAGAPAPVGLDAADVVYEQTSPDGPPRLVALYQSRDADRIGPVGPPDPADTRLLPVTRAAVAHTGAPKKFNDAVHGTAGIVDASYPVAPSAYARAGTYLFTSTAALHAVGPATVAPPDLFSYATDGLEMVTTGRKPATTLTVTVPGRAPVVWTDDPDRKLYTRRAPVVGAPNVVVVVVKHRVVVDANRDGRPVSTPEIFGSG